MANSISRFLSLPLLFRIRSVYAHPSLSPFLGPSSFPSSGSGGRPEVLKREEEEVD